MRQDFSFAAAREQQPRQNGDDGDDHQQLDEGGELP
jgi:hypothetical protein